MDGNIDDDDEELGCTNFGTIGNNLISFGLGVLTLIECAVKGDNSDEWDFCFDVFSCFEHQ